MNDSQDSEAFFQNSHALGRDCSSRREAKAKVALRHAHAADDSGPMGYSSSNHSMNSCSSNVGQNELHDAK